MDNQLANTPVFNRIKKEECCGCEGCANICPAVCIKMKADMEGFFFPSADLGKCIHCGRCERVCPVLHFKEQENLKNAYAGYSKSEDIVKASASGGMFSVCVEAFNEISTGKKAICGVAWDDDYKGCHHEILMDERDVARLMSSKYVQSRKNNIYKEIKQLLSKDVAVLFSGTPCEVAGLYTFLGKEYPNLYTIDIVCQGPSSPRAMKEYIGQLERRKHKKVSQVNMRYVHRTPWIPQWLRIDYEDGTKDIKVFYETEIGRAVHIMQRKSCYQCRFNGNGHYADVTIGDYHGADPEKEYYNPYGTSILVVNTLKGKRLFESISKDEINIFPADYDRIAKTNPRLKESWPPHLIRGQFSEWMQQKGLFIAARNSWSLRQRIRKEIPYGLRMVVRNLKSKINGGV